jgi:type IV protein arginine methyltransferase
VKSHTIIEAHPDVYQQMIDSGWAERPGVRILYGRWQDMGSELKEYDGIFFDTFSEHYVHMTEFHALLPKILRPGGLYSFFNGLAPRCRFFHNVYSRIVAQDLERLGFDTQFMELPVDTANKGVWEKHWDGVANRYWFQDTYRLPIVYWKEEQESDGT